MPLELARPWWLWALAALPVLIYYWQRSLASGPAWRRATALALRLAAAGAVVLALCGPQYRGQTSQPYVVAAVDVSRSITDDARQQADQFVAALGQAAGENRVAVVSFAARPEAVRPVDAAAPSGTQPSSRDRRDGTNIALALSAARAAIPGDCVPRVVLLSDGNATEGEALAAARLNGVPVDTVPLPAPAHEVYVSEVAAPAAVRPGVACQVEVVIESLSANQGTMRLRSGSEVLAEQQQSVAAGENRCRVPLTLTRRAADPLVVELADFRDTLAENNQIATAVQLLPKPHVFVAEGQPGGGKRLAAAWDEFFDVAVGAPAALPRRADHLWPYDLLALVNVPATALSDDGMQNLAAYVRDGGGLLVIGGDQAFTPGGYRGTPLDSLLPLAADTKNKPKPRLALVLVIDVSMSMEGKAIELSRQATRQAVDMLSPRDQVGVLTFADDTRWISPLGPCSDKSLIRAQIGGIAVGGRTNLYPALDRAYLALHEAFADRKHILLLTDGLSDPGDFDGLCRTIAADDITISTIGLGNEVAQDLLKHMAAIGKGHYYFCPDAAAVPRVFALETSSAGRIGISEEPCVPQAAALDGLLEDLGAEHLPPLMAYDETRLKSGARALLRTAGDDLLLAECQEGRGTVVAFASDLSNRWADAWLKWPEFNKFWTRVARRAMRSDPPQPLRRARPAYPAELRIRPMNDSLLRSLAEATGGKYAPQPSDVFADRGQTVPRGWPLWPQLLAAAALLLVAELAVRRWTHHAE